MRRAVLLLLFNISTVKSDCFIQTPWVTIRPLLQMIQYCSSIDICESNCRDKPECSAYSFVNARCALLGDDSGKPQICTRGDALHWVKTECEETSSSTPTSTTPAITTSTPTTTSTSTAATTVTSTTSSSTASTTSSTTTVAMTTMASSTSPTSTVAITTTSSAPCIYEGPPGGIRFFQVVRQYQYSYSAKTALVSSEWCRSNYPQIFNDPRLIVIQGYPCISTRASRTCVMFLDPPSIDSFICSYNAYPIVCAEKSNTGYLGISCGEFFANFEFIPIGTSVPNIPQWSNRANPISYSTCYSVPVPQQNAYWLNSVCKDNATSSDLSIIDRKYPLDGAFLGKLKTDTTVCQMVDLAFEESKMKYGSSGK